jgi:membrane-associated phospholipid phosphatase
MKSKSIRKAWWIRLAFLAFVLLGFFIIHQARLKNFQPLCRPDLSLCNPQDLLPIDRWVVERDGSVEHQRFSDVTQHAAVVWALTVLIVLFIFLKRDLVRFWHGVYFTVAASLASVFLNELVRTIYPRARPYVYRQLESSGFRHGDYTALYSGHTSFAAILVFCVYLILRTQEERKDWIAPHLIVSAILVFFTAKNRVLGGQHFVTDVVVSVFAAVMIGLFLWKADQKLSRY